MSIVHTGCEFGGNVLRDENNFPRIWARATRVVATAPAVRPVLKFRADSVGSISRSALAAGPYLDSVQAMGKDRTLGKLEESGRGVLIYRARGLEKLKPESSLYILMFDFAHRGGN